jgi:hypothetical protein
MPQGANQNSYSLLDMSGGMQNATSHLLKKRMEVKDSYNAAFNIRIGSACRRFGYEQVGQTIQYGNDSLYGGTYNYNVSSNRVIVGINNASGSNATLNFLDTGGYWTTILSSAAPNTRFQCLNYLNNFFVAGKAPGGQYMPLTMIDPTMTTQTYNTLNAPSCKFIAQFGGQLYALNCVVNGQTFSDRFYQSSPPLGVVTQVQNAISGWTTQIHVDSAKYLKVGMGIDIYGAQTSNLKYSNLVITSVDKLNNLIGVSGQTLNINANDEVWITGRFGQLTILWNTDYPTPQSADWLSIPSGLNETADISGWTVNTNRLLIFTKNSLIQWDGTNLTIISQSVGAVSHESIQNIGTWTIWLHTTGVWGYNITTGQLKMISKAITPLIQRINPVNLKYASAVVSNRTYKLSLGQLMNASPPDATYLQTTSTSTSSTSTSSTSSSTSSTSTSSTSTSTIITTTSTSSSSTSMSSTSSSTSTSLSTTTSVSFTTSTSSTSSSISTSTSMSTTTSLSTSTSSTTTTTAPSVKKITRLCYDFDLNIWWPELHTREIRFQFIHTMNGYTKPYFTDENGYLFRDETGLTDANNSIPMMLEFGRTNCGTEQAKIFASVLIDSERTRTGVMQYALDNGNWQTLGQITEDIGELTFPGKEIQKKGHDINLRFLHNSLGDPPYFNGWEIYWNIVQSLVNEVSP